MLRDEELKQAVIRQIVNSHQTFSDEIALAIGEYRDRVAPVLKELAKEGYYDIFEGAFHHSQIHYVRYEDLKKLMGK